MSSPRIGTGRVNPFQPSVMFHIETSHLFCRAKQMSGFYMKRNTGLKWADVIKMLPSNQTSNPQTQLP